MAALLTLEPPADFLVNSKTLSVMTGRLLGFEGTTLRTETLEFGALGSTRAVVRERRERVVRVDKTGKCIVVFGIVMEGWSKGIDEAGQLMLQKKEKRKAKNEKTPPHILVDNTTQTIQWREHTSK